MPTFGSLFAGIGGLDLGLERAGFECRWQVENDEWCQRVLTKHWPDVLKFGDVKTLTADELETVDLICGGFPCQPVSEAGRGLAQADERWLWPEFARIVRLLRPRVVLVENVPGLLARGMGDVLGELAACGYDAEWDCIPAAAVGAPHLRFRVFIVAYTTGDRLDAARQPRGQHVEDADGSGEEVADTSRSGRDRRRAIAEGLDEGKGRERGRVLEPTGRRADVADTEGVTERARLRAGESRLFRRGRLGDFGSQGDPWAAEPDVGRVAHGIPARVDRLRGLGNAVVPQVGEWVGRRMIEVLG